VVEPRRLRIHGRVQGVGFRAFVHREAGLVEIDGWVRNRRDGSVEALVWGEDAVIEGFLSRVREGPRWGRVDRVDVSIEPAGEPRPDGFEIRSDR
jgi:acylphosphatase